MPCKDNFGVDFYSASFEHNLVEDMNFPSSSSSGKQIGFLGVVSDFIDLSVVLDFMLDNDHLFDRLVIFLDGLVGFDGLWMTRICTLFVQFFDVLLVGQINFGHLQVVFLGIGGVGSKGDVAEGFLVFAALLGGEELVDPPLYGERGPVELLGVEGLVEVGGVSSPDELFCYVVIEGAGGFLSADWWLHKPPNSYIKSWMGYG